MEVEKREAEVIEKAIQAWRAEGVIDEVAAQKLTKHVRVKDSNANVLSLYAFISAVSCGLLAFGALVMDEKWIELLRRRFGFSEILVGVCFAIITLLFVYFSKKRIKKNVYSPAANETFNITIILSLIVTLAYFGRSIGYQNGNYAPLLLVAASAFGIAAWYLRSQLLWATMLVALAGWWGAQTYYWSGDADYVMGMNYPLRFTIFGVSLVLASFAVQHIKALQHFAKVTQVIAWVLFLTAAWTLSIFGNNGSFEEWQRIRQGKFWFWAMSFSLMLIGLIFYAFRKRDDFLRDVCLVFFLLNIYTRYFEYFWDKTNKGLFFAILAFSFWGVGRMAERWRKKQLENATKETQEE